MFREFPAVQWLELHGFTVEGPGLIPGQGPKTMQGVWHSQKRKKKNVFTMSHLQAALVPW